MTRLFRALSAHTSEEEALARPTTRRAPSWYERLNLRTVVVLIVMVFTALGLLLSAGAVNSIMRSYLYSEVDGQLSASASGWASNAELFARDPSQPRPPSSFYVEQIFPDGTSVRYNDSTSAPDLSMVKLDAGPFMVGPAPGSTEQARWRVVALSDNTSITVVARSMADEERLLHNLWLAQLGIAALVLALVAVGAGFVVARSLAPLRHVAATARAIADGDHDRRVVVPVPSTEVGTVGTAMNTMVEQLQHSLRTAQDKEEQMRRFVGDASHELRTPLTSVRGYAELYQSGATKDVDRVLATISAEAMRMNELVEGLLALARAEGMRLDLQSVDLGELSHRVVESYPGRDITLTDDGSDLTATVDADKIRQVLLNLINNALVHGAEPIQLMLSSTPSHVRLEVRDHGPGMSDTDAAHVFERFYRADSSRSRASGGSGLGLAIVSSLIDAHHGSISLHTAPGAGARFSVELPRTADSQDNVKTDN